MNTEQRVALNRIASAAGAVERAEEVAKTTQATLERAVFDALVEDVPTQEIATVLKVSPTTVRRMAKTVTENMSPAGR